MSLFRRALENELINEQLADDEEFVAFDLDGTVAHYDGWIGPDVIGQPIPKTIRLIQAYLEKGVKVKIFTARLAIRSEADRKAIRDAISEWANTHVGQPLESTCIKSPRMIRYYDDRARQVIENDGELVL